MVNTYDEIEINNNKLTRLINSRKNELHNEVINILMGMLNKRDIFNNFKLIKATEKNAKLIKSFLYHVVSEKNPQLNGMDKILIIKKMNEKEIISMLNEMPDLDELEENIRKHIENKLKTKNNNSNDSNVNTDTEEKKEKKLKKLQVKNQNNQE